ncbi:hypothetical protein NQ317_011769 [Molorchus minor]|uniref:Uncharacterized protein n=1 Tax=Molorchus minor TaxID=1323400 RepID=A0ABQ9J3V6_9CUCU|nr:hypothetical protein NQ317_011769 [Molorchus minor]
MYSEALEIDPLNKKTNAKLYFNRATALSRLSKTKEAIIDCTTALNLDETYLKALLRRAKCYMDLDIDPTQVFQSFFNNGHNQDFSFGFPGGFSFQFG